MRPRVEGEMNVKNRKCSVEGCGLKHIAKGFCRLHYMRVRYHGTVDLLPPYDRRGDKNPKWRGGQTTDGHGRIMVRAIGHPYANDWGYVYRYRIRMEKKLGRYLRSDEIVHHKDNNCSNDRISNLELCNSSLHSTIHDRKRIRNKKGQYT